MKCARPAPEVVPRRVVFLGIILHLLARAAAAKLAPNSANSDLRPSNRDALRFAQMARCIEVYTEYYKTDTDHRRLTWVHSLGRVVVAAQFSKRQHDLYVNTLQASVLCVGNLLFQRFSILRSM